MYKGLYRLNIRSDHSLIFADCVYHPLLRLSGSYTYHHWDRDELIIRIFAKFTLKIPLYDYLRRECSGAWACVSSYIFKLELWRSVIGAYILKGLSNTLGDKARNQLKGVREGLGFEG